MTKLAVVEASTGEIVEGCQRCEPLADQLAGAERDIRAWRQRCANLERDDERKAREHPSWEKLQEFFDYHRRACEKPRARFNAERFWMALPFLDRDGEIQIRKAIRGAAFEPFVSTRRNGKANVHNGWDLIFRSREKFEDFVERAPEVPEATDLHRLTEVLLARMAEDDRPLEDRVFEAVGRAQQSLYRKPAAARAA